MGAVFIFSTNDSLVENIQEILIGEGFSCFIQDDFAVAKKLVIDLEPRLIIINNELKLDRNYNIFLNFLAKHKIAPFLIICSNTDGDAVQVIRNLKPDGYLLFPFHALNLKISIEVILARYGQMSGNLLGKVNVDGIPFMIKQTLVYVEENIFKKILVKDLAALTQWEINHFIKIFFKYVGVTPYQYILNEKVGKAKLLLIQTDLSINQISFELGFKSYTNFISAFKKTTYLGPKEYRLQNFKNQVLEVDFFRD